MSRVLVTGGAGAIGSNLVRALVARGDDVVVLDDLTSGRAEQVDEGARLVRGSITDPAALATAFAGGPELVFHLAARFANQNSVEHPADDLAVNAGGTLAVLEAAVARGVRKVLFVSSSCIYGAGAADEDGREHFAVETPYAMTKMLGEGYARFFAHQHGLDTVIVRPFNVYGPGELPGPYRNVIPNFLARAARGEPLVITGTGEETRDFTFVDDCVAAFLAAIDVATEPGATYNVATGVETRINELAAGVLAVTGSMAEVVHQERRAWDATASRRGAIERTCAELGFVPRTSVADGLVRTWEWLRLRV